jgi:hypothetical protein
MNFVLEIVDDSRERLSCRLSAGIWWALDYVTSTATLNKITNDYERSRVELCRNSERDLQR